ncbi:membrane protease YdiL (CAAX protease family) [Symbiobacterium terraclitae]|uniref:Membrane protease YdiL (CAAX protease family) n=1 Tax=Symbiobacterium terraclitae TaxID=557451 RepID=A0ABS4JQM2_9FIRM|nr:CPBP family intramembrane glutamic endopeptidase [Symbiobacterium terraclitae]MBP2017815.1 membrane protease YdiL (CAAX protease family) [Symbiobacterium terraclitae]
MAEVRIALGGISLSYHLPRVLVFALNGFTEEFLFRGALQTRLALLTGDGWGLVLTSLIFGVMHVGAAAALLGGDFLAGMALCVASHAPAGLLFGLTALRTRSLISPTVAHIALNLASVAWPGA